MFGASFRHCGILRFHIAPESKETGPTAGTNLAYKVHQVVNVSFLGLGNNICHLFPPPRTRDACCGPGPDCFGLVPGLCASSLHSLPLFYAPGCGGGGAVFPAGASNLCFSGLPHPSACLLRLQPAFSEPFSCWEKTRNKAGGFISGQEETRMGTLRNTSGGA